MDNISLKAIAVLLVCSLIIYNNSTSAFGQQVYSEICDASAAVAIDPAHFLVAHDEGDTLYLFRNDGFALTDGQVQPLKTFDFKTELQIQNNKESDIEGAAKVDNRVFWITSHGRNKKGKIRKNRYRLFATDIVGTSSKTDLLFFGAYANLAVDIQKPENWRVPQSEVTLRSIESLIASLRLDEKKVKSLKPKKDGLNIEALAALPDKSGLLIGLRNPVPDGNALIIPLLNANELVGGEADSAKFGQPIFLNLRGRGIRSMDYVPAIDAFLIVAGPIDDESSFKLFKWSGTPEAKLIEIENFHQSPGVNPEALIAYEEGRRIQVLYDEGSRVTGGVKCKDMQKTSRSFADQWYVIE